MFELTLTKKTGFKVTDINKPVIIRDMRGILFYSTESLTPKVKSFNLPAGTYMVDMGNFREMDAPVKYNLIPLPKPERIHPSPIGFEFQFEPNPNKCTINFIDKTITFDTSFLEMSLPIVYFILYHEYGHQYFKTEKYCDAFAHNAMIKKGFNPSQIGRAQIFSLSYRQAHRKNYLVEKIIEANGNNA